MKAGSKGTELILENQARFLRDKDVLLESDAVTPATRIYFTIQLLYLSEQTEDAVYNQCLHFIADMMDTSTLTEVREALSSIRYFVQQKEYYRAIKHCNVLVQFEKTLFAEMVDSQ
jgi:flagellar protein FlbT